MIIYEAYVKTWTLVGREDSRGGTPLGVWLAPYVNGPGVCVRTVRQD